MPEQPFTRTVLCQIYREDSMSTAGLKLRLVRATLVSNLVAGRLEGSYRLRVRIGRQEERGRKEGRRREEGRRRKYEL